MKNEKLECLNCGFQLNEDLKFCSNCGQEAKYNILSIRHLVKSFFDSIFNLDTKIVNSIRDVWIPNKITRYFIEGKRTKYMHPFRFFFISLILFFGLLSIATKNLDNESLIRIKEKEANYKLHQRFETIKDSLSLLCNPGVIDSLQHTVFKEKLIGDTSTFFQATIMGVDLGEIGITTEDVISLTAEQIIEKYNISSRKEKYIVTQMLRLTKDLNSAIKFIIGNMLWAMIFITIAGAFIFWLLYIRHESYYVESVLHITHFHTISMLLGSFFLIYLNYFKYAAVVYIILNIIATIYLYLTMKGYYHQGHAKTILKLIVLFTAYNIFAFIVMIAIVLLSAAIF